MKRLVAMLAVAGAVVVGAMALAGTSSAVAGTCSYNHWARGTTSSGSIWQITEDRIAWRTSGSIDGCEGTSVLITSSSYWCYRDSAVVSTCSAGYSSAHAETNSQNSVSHFYWNVKVSQDVTKYGGRTIRCTYTGSLPYSGILICSG